MRAFLSIAMNRFPKLPHCLALAIIVAIALLCSASSWSVYGHTWDEPEHLAAGLELLDRGKYEYDIQHPRWPGY